MQTYFSSPIVFGSAAAAAINSERLEMNWRQAGGGRSMIGKLLKEFVFTIFV